MIVLAAQGAASAAPTFDAAEWLASFSKAGGGYALTSERRLWLIISGVPADTLEPMMAALVNHPGRHEAVCALIERRQIGELAA